MKLNRRAMMTLGLSVALTVGQSLQAEEQKDIVDTAVGAGSFKTLAAALGAADLAGTLKGKGPFTVFAPTDAAFAKLPKGTLESLLKPENKEQLTGILTYHVVSGNVMARDVVKLSGAETLNGQRVDIKTTDGRVAVDSANVLSADIECSNGVIHVIDSVMLPSSDNIPETAIKTGNFKTLVAAAKAAGLVNALSDKGPLTVFAPTDSAFAKLPKGTVESLLKPENKQELVDILKYHVVVGRIYSEAAVKAGHAETLLGKDITISVQKAAAMVNNAKLVATDIDASNGVIHVIDSVLLPPADKKVTAAEAKKMIETTVAHGTRLYNSGHHSECAMVYQTAMKKMSAYSDVMPPLAMRHITTAMHSASRTHCASTQAWTLRRGLDGACAALMK